MMIQETIRSRGFARWALAAAIFATISATTKADTTATYSGPPIGSWSTASNWSGTGGFAPNNGANGQNYQVVIDGNGGQNSAVSIDGNFTINGLTVTSGDSLTITDNNALSLTGGSTLTNAGTINLSSGGGNATVLGIVGGDSNTVTLSGAGVIVMGVNNNRIEAFAAGLTLDSKTTIMGHGAIGNGNSAFTFLNEGTLTAVGALTVNPGTGFINNKLMQAGDGVQIGTMVLQSDTFTNNGVILANIGSSVQLNNSAIIGGTLTSIGTGSFNAVSGYFAQQLSGPIVITGGSVININDNAAVNFAGGSTYTNNGTIAIVSSGGNQSSFRLNGAGTVTLAGTGMLLLATNNNNVVDSTTPGMTLLNATSHTIQGSGRIGGVNTAFALINAGTITAVTSLGNRLVLAPGLGISNSGVMQAAAGSSNTLAIADVVSNTSTGLILANADSSVQIANGQISGGTLQSIGTGRLTTVSGQFSSVIGALAIASGTQIDVSDYSALGITTGGTITNNGVISLNSGGGNRSELIVTGAGTVTLAGSGSVLLSTVNANHIVADTAGATLENAAGHTIAGMGVLSAAGQAFKIINEGHITALGSAVLTVSPGGGVVNTGIMQAGNGINPGTLNLAVDQITNTNGIIRANAGSVVRLTNNVNITGGTLTASGGGTFTTVSGDFTPVLTGPILIDTSAVIGVSDYSSLSIATGSTITNNGVISLNSSGGNRSTLIVKGLGTVTLAGSGSISLSTVNVNRILAASTGSFLDNTATHTIVGMGAFRDSVSPAYTVINEGHITALGTAPLYVGPGAGVFNTGIMQAGDGANPGTLQLADDTYSNFGGVILANTGSSVQLFNGANIVGGTLTSTGTGSLNTVYANFTAQLSGPITLSAGTVFNVADYSSLNLVAGAFYTNNGVISLNSNDGNHADLILNGLGNITLAGSGSVSLSTVNSNRIIANGTGSTLVNTASHTIVGSGVISSAGGTYQIVNDGTITALGNAPLTVSPGAGVLNNHLLQAGDGANTGTLQLGIDVYTNTNGIIRANAGSTVIVFGGSTIIGGTLTTAGTGSSFTTQYADFSATLVGPITLTAGMVFNVADYSALNLAAGAVYTNNGLISLNSTGGNQADLVLNGNGTVTLAGTGSVVLSTTNTNRIIANGTATTLDNTAAHSILGAGTITGAGGTFKILNEGVITAQGGVMSLNPGAGVVNTHLIQAGNGTLTATLRLLNDTYTNTGGIIKANAGSTILVLNGATIIGGTLTANGTGSSFNTQYGNFSATLVGPTTLTSDVLFNIADYTALNLAAGAVYTNNGIISLNSAGGSQADLVLSGPGTVTLAGSGSVVLSTSNNNRIIANSLGAVLDNTATQTIVGSGALSGAGGAYTIINEGTITALGGLMVVNPGAGVVNTGLIQAGTGTLTGSLKFLNDLYTNTGGTIKLNPGSTALLLNGTTIVGGTLTGADASSYFYTAYGNFDVTLGGAMTLTSGTLLYIVDYSQISLAHGSVITNNGTITLNAGGNHSDLVLAGAGTVQLTGTGAVLFATTGVNRLIADSLGATLDNAGTHTLAGVGSIGNTGPVFTFTNEGIVLANSANNTLLVAPGVSTSNTGIFHATNSGTLRVNGVFNQDTAGTLTAGTYISDQSSTINLADSPNITTIGAAATVILNGPTSAFIQIDNPVNTTGFVTANQGIFELLGNRSYTTASDFTNSGTLQLGGGTFNSPSLTNNAAGTITGFGFVTPRPLNHGTIVALGGTLAFASGINGGSGTIQVDTGATLDLSLGTANSNGDLLVIQTGGSLVLGAHNILVKVNYANGDFGAGNSFNKHADVSASTGLILADGTNTQTVTGNVTGGTLNNPTMNFGNIHVGATASFAYAVNNIGLAPASGPSLLFAIQTAANGGSITDPRLTGSGVTAQNLGPIALNDASSSLTVLFSGLTSGSLTVQFLHIANNFDGNSAASSGSASLFEQTISISGAVWNYASFQTSTTPMALGNHHVGDPVAPLNFLISNTAPTDGFSEKLNGTIAANSGNVVIAGGFSLLNAGATDSSHITVNYSSATPGPLNGTAGLALNSDGQAPATPGNSGLGLTSLGTVTLQATGGIYRLANPLITNATVAFGINHHVGDVVTQNVTVTNNVPNDGFSEKLDGTLSNPVGPNTFSGNFSLLAPAAASNITATLDTSSPGAKTGSELLTLVSNGSGTSGLGTTSTFSITLTSSGSVYRLAAPLVTNATVAFGINHHVGDVVTQNVTVTNNVPNDGFSEKLDGTLSNPVGSNTFSGNFSLLAPAAASNITATLDTSTAGAKSGSALLTLVSNGNGSSGLGTTPASSLTLTSSGSVYRLAAPATIPNINLGVLHVGSPGSKALTISNIQIADGFSEKLKATFTSYSGSATASGGPVTVAAGATNNTMTITLDTSTAQLNRTGNAVLHLDSDGTGTSGLGLTAISDPTVTISADVYNYAAASMRKDSGNGTYTLQDTTHALLDFGSIANGGNVFASLSALNIAAAPADSLSGTWTVNAADFGISNFSAFSSLAAGDALSNLDISFSSLTPGLHTGTITFHPTSVDVNAAGVTLSDFTLSLSANVQAAVPEPATAALLLVGAPLLIRRRRRVRNST